MRKIYVILIALAVVVAISIQPSCTKDYLEPVVIEIPDTVSFSEYIIPIFNDHCNNSGCHSSGGVAPDLTATNAFADLWNYGLIDTVEDESSILYQRMNSTSKPMPPSGKLATGEEQLVLEWIKQGALDN